jgi:Holliday junction DNA helicase RuvB
MNINNSQPLQMLAQAGPDEQQFDFHPHTFDEYLGQADLKKKLVIYTTATLMRQEPLDHVLFFGPPGLGKTTLATIMAQVLGVTIKICSGPMLERTGDLVALLSGLAPRDILFIDEIHRLPTQLEEVLYSAMEQFKIDVIIGQGAGAQAISLPINPFTLIGATTKTGMLSAPLLSRFGIVERLDFYSEEDLKKIVLQSAHFLTIDFSDKAALLIARAARGTPRIAKKIVRRVRDFMQVKNQTAETINDPDTVVQDALNFLGIDAEGLHTLDHALLRVLVERFQGGPVGLETLASLLAEDKDTIEDVYEPYLIRCGYLEKTIRGRQIPAQRLPYVRAKILGQHTLLTP